MKRLGFVRHKTQDTLKKKINKHKIQLPTLQYPSQSLKESNSFSFTEITHNSMEQTRLIRVSTNTQPAAKPIKKHIFNKNTNFDVRTPTKMAIKPKNVEFPDLRNNEVEYSCSPKHKNTFPNRRKSEKLERTIQDCQRLVKMMENLTKRNQPQDLSLPKMMDQVALKNIFITPRPKQLLEQPRTDSNEPVGWMKQRTGQKCIQVTKINVRQNIFFMSSPQKSSP